MRITPRILAAILALLTITASSPAAGLFDLFGGMSGGNDSTVAVQYVEGDKSADDEILIIKIKGMIYERSADDSDSMPWEMKRDMIDNLRKDVKAALERSSVKAILLEVDSPGGEVTATDIMHHELLKIKEAKKPIVALIGTMAASGGYYVACVADWIIAHPTSIIGSIGVLMRAMNIEKLAAMIGYKDVTLKSEKAQRKDILSPFREMTSDEKAMMMTVLNGIHERFLEVVAAGRKKSVADITPLADGSIFLATQAKQNGLIDATGYREDAIKKAQDLAGLKAARVVKRKTKKGLAQIFSEMAEMHSGMPALIHYLQNTLESSGTPTVLYQFSLPGTN